MNGFGLCFCTKHFPLFPHLRNGLRYFWTLWRRVFFFGNWEDFQRWLAHCPWFLIGIPPHISTSFDFFRPVSFFVSSSFLHSRKSSFGRMSFVGSRWTARSKLHGAGAHKHLAGQWVIVVSCFNEMGVSKNRGTPNHPLKNRVFDYFHHPFWGTSIFGNTHKKPWQAPNRSFFETCFMKQKDLFFLKTNWEWIDGSWRIYRSHLFLAQKKKQPAEGVIFSWESKGTPPPY